MRVVAWDGPLLSPLLLPPVVTLSAAKGLSRWAQRYFAEFTLSEANGLSMTGLNLQKEGWQSLGSLPLNSLPLLQV